MTSTRSITLKLRRADSIMVLEFGLERAWPLGPHRPSTVHVSHALRRYFCSRWSRGAPGLLSGRVHSPQRPLRGRSRQRQRGHRGPTTKGSTDLTHLPTEKRTITLQDESQQGSSESVARNTFLSTETEYAALRFEGAVQNPLRSRRLPVLQPEQVGAKTQEKPKSSMAQSLNCAS